MDKLIYFFVWIISVNLFDLAPQYAGMMMGFANTFGNLPGMISPVVTGYIVQNKVKRTQL